MSFAGSVVNGTIKGLTQILCRIDASQLSRVPNHGPLILASNHINFLDIPLVYTQLQPRLITGFVKSETWDSPVMAYLFNLWGGIPIHRGEADVRALRAGLAALEQGQILAIAPEGTRSGHGRLNPGRPGIVLVALASGAPILPVVYYGGENFHSNLRRLRRTEFNIVVGYPFYLDARGVKTTRLVRQMMTDEIMYQLAALLPPGYRGHYADLNRATETYLRFAPGSQSNLSELIKGAATLTPLPAV